VWDADLKDKLENEYETIIAKEGKTVLGSIKGGTSPFDVDIPGIRDFIDGWTYALSFDINDETISQLRDVLDAGINGGLGMVPIRNNVRDMFDDMNNYRAMRIARTEVIRASNYATEAAYL
jgi:hypothetical protein